MRIIILAASLVLASAATAQSNTIPKGWDSTEGIQVYDYPAIDRGS